MLLGGSKPIADFLLHLHLFVLGDGCVDLGFQLLLELVFFFQALFGAYPVFGEGDAHGAQGFSQFGYLLVCWEASEVVLYCFTCLVCYLSKLKLHEIASRVLKLTLVLFGEDGVATLFKVDEASNHGDESQIG